ncbi:hypothetical protein P0082_05030 [Candidatus Haliotispira prima]|uniref:Uncharacterized protein n=1 Tax=Candidatus Haliotispira prima TaxID=3034016 RepID=A0ABY8MK93_9SPIO|nr:hypothetical protein P0082_05030 [Candidatus Haliotispira prima]
MASSLQLEMKSDVEITNMGAVVRLAAEAGPTKAEALASKGHVRISIPAGATRKISINRHYTTNFDDGLTLADLLTPATDYKLYLYFPDIASNTELTGLSIRDNMAEVSFTTASLPAEGDTKWLSSNDGKCVASLDAYYFMQEQTGTAVCYFYLNFDPPFIEASVQNSRGTFDNLGTYSANVWTPSAILDSAYGLISGYTSNTTNHYAYWIGKDKMQSIENQIRVSITNQAGLSTLLFIPVTRH